MSYSTPPSSPRRLERSMDDKVLGGVCSGIAQYLNTDATVVRLLTVVLTLVLGFPAAIYFVAWFLMPEGRRSRYPENRAVYPPTAAPGPWPTAPRSRPEDPVWGNEGAPWEQPQPAPAPPPWSPGAKPSDGRPGADRPRDQDGGF